MPAKKFSGARVREIRENNGLTRDELAMISRVSVRAIAYTETEERTPGGVTVGRLARALGVKVIEFSVADDDDVDEVA